MDIQETTLRNECWDKNFHGLAFEYMFNERAKYYSRRTNWLKILGILVPATIAVTIITYDNIPEIKSVLLSILSAVTLIQFYLSVLAIINKWDDELSYAYESSQAHNSIQRRYKALAQLPHTDYAEMLEKYKLLEIEANGRNQQDSKHNINEWERRKAMRFALKETQRKNCIGCGIMPVTIESTECDVCGKFSFKHRIL